MKRITTAHDTVEDDSDKRKLSYTLAEISIFFIGASNQCSISGKTQDFICWFLRQTGPTYLDD